MANPLPKIIHFIWIGGSIPLERVYNIHRIASIANNSGFEVKLWVDKPSNYHHTVYKRELDTEHSDQPHRHSRKFFHDLALTENLQVVTIDSLATRMKASPLFSGDSTQHQQFWACVNRERVGLRNLAAASDLLRYAILYLEGGYYIDTDTELPFSEEQQRLRLDNPEYGFLCNGKGLVHSALGISHFSGGNDIIACQPRHPIIENTLVHGLQLYHQADRVYDRWLLETDSTQKPPSDVQHALTLMDKKRRHSKHYSNRPFDHALNPKRQDLTLALSGPELLGKQIELYFNALPEMSGKENLIRSEALSKFGFKFNTSDPINRLEREGKVSAPLECTRKVVAGVTLSSMCYLSWIGTDNPSSVDDADLVDLDHVAIRPRSR